MMEAVDAMFDRAQRRGYVLAEAGANSCAKLSHQRPRPNQRRFAVARERAAEVRRLWMRGSLTQAEIAMRTGCSKTNVSHVVTTSGLSKRTRRN